MEKENDNYKDETIYNINYNHNNGLISKKIIEGQINVFTSMIGSIDQFKEFEKCIELKNYKLTEILYLKVNRIDELTELAKLKYGKIYDQSDILKKHIEDYQIMRDEIIEYSKKKYKIVIKDFFETEIKI